MAAPPRATLQPGSCVAPAGFQKIVDASLQGDAVAAKPRASAHDPISFRPKAWARSAAGSERSADANKYRVARRTFILLPPDGSAGERIPAAGSGNIWVTGGAV